MTTEKIIKRNSIIDWGAYALIIGLVVQVLLSVNDHGRTLAGMEAWIRVAANAIGVRYGN